MARALRGYGKGGILKKSVVEFVMMLLIIAVAYAVPPLMARDVRQVSTEPAQSGHTILIDAGHGASDSGKVGINQALEKDINLEIALLVRDMLQEEGITVVMTRVDDSPLYQETDSNKKLADMKKRIQMMTDYPVEFAVSIHQNSYTRESVKGPQVFYYKDSVEGEKLAQSIQSAFDLVMGEDNTRTIKPNGEYYLLVRSPVPTVICECGFLSNWEEAQKLVTPEYQQEVARAVVQGILDYLGLARQ